MPMLHSSVSPSTVTERRTRAVRKNTERTERTERTVQSRSFFSRGLLTRSNAIGCNFLDRFDFRVVASVHDFYHLVQRLRVEVKADQLVRRNRINESSEYSFGESMKSYYVLYFLYSELSRRKCYYSPRSSVSSRTLSDNPVVSCRRFGPVVCS